ncbi:MAG: CPBP family intramembrane metalloprotease [Elusimicrobia bacterium]|nr:CPBP family intramembrane metalloprotease [Elusimicrobiota bacterium]
MNELDDFFKKIDNSEESSKIFYILGILLIFCVHYLLSRFSQSLIIDFYNHLLLVKKFTIDKADFISLISVVTVFWGAAVLLVIGGLKLYALSPKDIGWKKTNIKNAWKILIGIISVPIYKFLFCVIVVHIQYGCLTHFSFKVNQPAFDTLMFYYFAIFTIFIGPIVEELFFRGFIQTALGKKLDFKYALFITAFLFALNHSYKIHHWYTALNFFAIGLLCGLLKKWDGTLWSSIVAHSFLGFSAKWIPVICK